MWPFSTDLPLVVVWNNLIFTACCPFRSRCKRKSRSRSRSRSRSSSWERRKATHRQREHRKQEPSHSSAAKRSSSRKHCSLSSSPQRISELGNFNGQNKLTTMMMMMMMKPFSTSRIILGARFSCQVAGSVPGRWLHGCSWSGFTCDVVVGVCYILKLSGYSSAASACLAVVCNIYYSVFTFFFVCF